MTILDTLSDPLVTGSAGALGGGSLVGALAYVAAKVIGWRKQAGKNAATVAQTDREADAAETVAKVAADAAVKVAEIESAPALIAKVNELWDKRNECEDARRKDRQDAEERERKAREECKKEIVERVAAETAPLRAQLARVSEHAADTRESTRGEDTGVHELRAIAAEVRRTPTPPDGTDRRSLPMLPPPKRGKES